MAGGAWSSDSSIAREMAYSKLSLNVLDQFLENATWSEAMYNETSLTRGSLT